MNYNEAVEKVKKLHALAANNTNEEEQKAALSAADTIIQKYRIDQAHLEAQGQVKPEEMVRKVVWTGGRRTSFREVILGALTTHYACVWYLCSARVYGKGSCQYTVVGRENDVNLVQYMFDHIEQLTLRLGKWHTEGKGRGYGKAWQSGFASGIAAQYREMREQMKALVAEQNASAALVVLDKRATEARAHMNVLMGGSLKSAKSITGGRDYNAYNHGHTEGKKASLPTAAPSNTPKLGA